MAGSFATDLQRATLASCQRMLSCNLALISEQGTVRVVVIQQAERPTPQ